MTSGRWRFSASCLAVAVLSAACSGAVGIGSPDGGEDEPDAAMKPDASTDSGTPLDAGPDAGGDPGLDGGIDAGTDAGLKSGRLSLSPVELVFSGVKGTTIGPHAIAATNSGNAAVQLMSATVTGAAFAVSSSSALPVTLGPGQTANFAVTFSPSSATVGIVNGRLNFASSLGPLDAGLFALSTNGLQGANEPPLALCVAALGYAINVGGTGLSLGTGAAPIGDEVVHPLFRKADAGPVGLRAVARYSPNETLPFGWYLPGADGGAGARSLVGTIAFGQEQTLNPGLTPDSGVSFDPGTTAFGIYVSSLTFNRNTYTQDALNTGPTIHATRVYPLKDRQGRPVPYAFLIGFEDAANGDYQDYVFVISNVVP